MKTILVLLYPFVPHLVSELWTEIADEKSLDETGWPAYAEDVIEPERLLIVVQVDGRVRGKITVSADASRESIEAEALQDARVTSFLQGRKIQRIVQVPRRLVNIVLEG